MSILVTYYSRSGHTARLGRTIAGALGADVQEIAGRRTFRGPWGFLAGGFQAARKKTPELEPLSRDPGDYAVVVVGTPVWAGTMSSPVRSFLTRYGGRMRKTAFFITSGGGDTGRTFPEMEWLAGCAPLAILAMRARKVRKASGELLGEEADRLVAGVRAADR